MSSSDKMLNIATLNCQSLCNKTDGVLQHIMENDIDICFLQETFMKAKDTAIFNEVKEQGLKMFSVPRENGGHGGLAVIFNPEINLKRVTRNSSNLKRYKTFEYIECTLKTSTELLRFCNIYRRPYYARRHRFTPNQFFPEFEDYLTTLVTKSGTPVLMGDFNLHLENVDDSNCRKFNDLFEQFCYKQNVPSDVPTHRDGGCLDLVLTCNEAASNVTKVRVHPHGTSSDHFMVSFELNCSPELTKRNETVSYRNFKSINIPDFKLDLKNSSLRNVISLPDTSDNLDVIVNTYTELLQVLMDKHCPVITKQQVKTKKDPWFDDQLKELLRKCRAAERKWQKSKAVVDKTAHKNLVKTYLTTLNSKRKTFNSGNLDKVKNNKRKLFGLLNKLMGKEKSILPESNSDRELADDFSKYFSEKITNIRSIIEQEQTTHGVQTEDCSECRFHGERLLQFELLNKDDLHKLISSMSNKFCCLDPIPTWLLHDCFEELSPVLLKILNLSLKFGSFPSLSKTAVVKPSVKDFKECTEVHSNYRPVSNISFLSKLIEKAVLNQVNHHLSKHNLICSSQSGYRQYHSCETLNIKLFDDMLKCIDEGSTVALLLLDMSAAFDTVDHTLLLQQLKDAYGFTGVVLQWFESYLSSRTCSVNINDTFSNMVCLLFGVPQGSIVGPILFILYTKHIQHIAHKYGLSIQLYADDTQLYIAFESTNALNAVLCKENIEGCLKEIKVWMCAKYLKLNEGKTKLLFLCKPISARSKHAVEDINKFSLVTFDSEIEELDWVNEKEVKSLGLHLDSQLKLDNHIAYLRKFCFGQIMSWKRIGYCLTQDVKFMLVKQIILSKLDYNNALLADLPLYMIQSLQSIINCAIRFIYNVSWSDHISPYIIRSHILPVQYRIDYKVCVLVFNCLHQIAPVYLQNLLIWNVPSLPAIENASVNYIPRATQDPSLLTIPFDFGNKTRYRSRTFSHYAPKVWNKLPYQIRTCAAKENFKKDLKTYFFNLYIDS